jgi:iron complex outermembrane receptor protein
MLAALNPGHAGAQSDPSALDEPIDQPEDDFAGLELEELMQIQVTSVVGRAQPLLDMPAAIYVLTAEDLRRSGHRSIAEALRMVPGFTVGQITPSQWAISARGFADRFANNLPVLIDGRTVYDPLFSGVFWHVQDVLFEDVDRIEAIRGPGATLWGANAVNGVINITTKSAKETQGLYITGGGGNQEQGFGALRYGGKISEDVYYRVWGKYDNHASFDNITGAEEPNGWDMYRGGFRVDWEGGDELEMTAQGDIYGTGHMSERVRVPVPGSHLGVTTTDLDPQYQGGNFLFRIGQSHGSDEGWTVQSYYDRTKSRGGQPGFEVRRDTIDVDYRQYLPLGSNDEHVLMWGLGYRHTRDRNEARAQRPHGLRVPAQRASHVDARRPADRLGRHLTRRAYALARRGRSHAHDGLWRHRAARRRAAVGHVRPLAGRRGPRARFRGASRLRGRLPAPRN